MQSFLLIIEILAILAFAYSGVIEARRSGFDFVGVLTIAVVSAFGGGTLRDVLLDRHPIYWIEHWEFLIDIFALSIAAALLLRYNKDFSSRRILVMVDALGLGLFAASGVGVAFGVGTPILPAALIGVITATFGGVLRDVLCSRSFSSRPSRFTRRALFSARGIIFCCTGSAFPILSGCSAASRLLSCSAWRRLNLISN